MLQLPSRMLGATGHDLWSRHQPGHMPGGGVRLLVSNKMQPPTLIRFCTGCKTSCNQLWCLAQVSTQTWCFLADLKRRHLCLLKVFIQKPFIFKVFLVKIPLWEVCISQLWWEGEWMGRLLVFPVRCCVFWMAVLWVVMVLGDHSWERQACIFVGWMGGRSQLSLGSLRSYGRREMCCFQTVRGKVMMQHGCEGEMNGICYITWPVFQDLGLNCELLIPFYCSMRVCKSTNGQDARFCML